MLQNMRSTSLINEYSKCPRWVNWKDDGRKVPLNPKNDHNASSTNSKTWGTYGEAIANSDKIGIMLGEVKRGVQMTIKDKKGDVIVQFPGLSLCGIDLDGCFENGKMIAEAQEVVDRFKRYTEVSPSGKGVHILFTIPTEDVERLCEEYKIGHRKTFSVGAHREMSIDFSSRFYTVTSDVCAKYSIHEWLDGGVVDWFLRTAGPAFQTRFAKHGGRTKDNSRSGHAFRFFMSCYARGLTEDDAIAEIKKRKGPEGDWARSKGRDLREMQRAWGNAVGVVEEGRTRDGIGDDYLETTTFSTVRTKRIKWIWPGYLAAGKLTMFVGAPDCGKTQIGADLAARVTKGLYWPDKSGPAPMGDVLVFNAEDDLADTLVPRFIAAGANLKRVHGAEMKSGTFNLAENMKQLEAMITPSIKLVIIDPITAFLGAKIDTFRQTHVRSVLTPLAKLASERSVAILMIAHFNKNSKETNPMYRISDSAAFSAACRCIMGVGREPDGEGRLIFQRMRNSLSAYSKAIGLGYYIEETKVETDDGSVKQPRVVWDDQPVDISLEECLKPAKWKASPRLDAAVDWLKKQLSRTSMSRAKVADLRKLASKRNITSTTLHRAMEELNFKRTNVKGVEYLTLIVMEGLEGS